MNETPRLGLGTYEQGDSWDHTDTVEAVDEKAIERGPIAERPATGDYDDELYHATDQNITWRWDSTDEDWNPLNTGTSESPVPGTTHLESASVGEASTDFGKWTDRLEPLWQANRIRAEAGIPDHETTTVNNPGISDETVLSDSTGVTITSESEASTESDSGSGTESDPYVFSDRNWTGPFAWDDSGADYYIALENNRHGNTGSRMDVDTGETLILQNCEVFESSGRAIQITANGSIELRDTHISGAGGGAAIVYTGAVPSDYTQTYRNVLIDDAQEPLNDEGIYTINGDIVFDIEQFEINNAGGTGLRLDSTVKGSIKNGTVDNAGSHAFRTRSSASGPLQATIEFVHTKNQSGSSARIGFVDGATFKYCFFEDSPADFRQVQFRTSDEGDIPKNVEVAYCRFKNTNGSNTAGNECLESFNGYKVDFHHNWVESCPEDAYEHVDSNGFCNVRYCVADNTDGQAVDYFGNGDGGAGTDYSRRQVGGIVEHIYGDVGTVVINIHDTNGVIVKGHVHVEERNGNAVVDARNRNAESGVAPNDLRIFGPLSRDGVAGDKITATDFTSADMGDDNVAIYWDGDTLQVLDPDNVAPSDWTAFR